MKIYELEVSNYKSLENYGMPLRFSSLNLLIGENDSGKSALLDAIQILFGYKEVKDIDFYDPKKAIKIKTRLSEVRQSFLCKEMDFLNSEYDFMDPSREPPYLKFEDELHQIENYSFYEDFRQFYIDYKENFTVTFEKIFRLESKKIISDRDIQFSYPLKQNKHLHNLLKNHEFIDYMTKEIEKINNEFGFYSLNGGNDIYIDSERTIFLYDLKNDSIIYRINKIINSKLYSECPWKIKENLLDILSEKKLVIHSLSSIMLPPEKLTPEELGLDEYNPYVNFFSTVDLDIEKISNILFMDNFEALLNIDKTKDDDTLEREIYDHLNNELKNFLLEKLFNSKENLELFNKIKDNLNFLLNKLLPNKTILDIDFSLQDANKIEKYLKPTIKLRSLECGREIEVKNKSQGYLRKLLITDFLLLTKNIGLENENGRIILIEEPEIHMHISAQKEIISLLKENLLEGSSQVFITTHSHTMIENIDLENIFVFHKDLASGITDIKNLRQINIFDREEILTEITSSLGISNMDLLFLKKAILLVEGAHDAAFIKGLCERPEFAIDTEKILFKITEGQANIFYYVGLGEFLKLKTILIYDNHEFNHRDTKKIMGNPYISDSLKKEIFKIVVLEEQDILNYFDFEYVAKYKGIPKEKLPQKNQKIGMKEFLKKNSKWLSPKEIEYLARTMPKIPEELTKNIMNFLKLLIDFNK